MTYQKFPSIQPYLQTPEMTLAYNLAVQAFHKGEVPVGAILTYKGKIIAKAHNTTICSKDPLAHAELLVLRQAHKIVGKYLTDCALYVTLEPCALCAAAIVTLRLSKVYFAAYDPKGGAIDHNARLATHSLFKPEIYGGIQEAQCSQLLKAFFEKLRLTKLNSEQNKSLF